jgi:hypothetical protein
MHGTSAAVARQWYSHCQRLTATPKKIYWLQIGFHYPQNLYNLTAIFSFSRLLFHVPNVYVLLYAVNPQYNADVDYEFPCCKWNWRLTSEALPTLRGRQFKKSVLYILLFEENNPKLKLYLYDEFLYNYIIDMHFIIWLFCNTAKHILVYSPLNTHTTCNLMTLNYGSVLIT